MQTATLYKHHLNISNPSEWQHPEVTQERINTILHARGLARLEHFLDQSFQRCIDESSELALLQRVNDLLSDRNIMRLIIEEIEGDSSRMLWVAENSSRNPNGFYRLMLLGGTSFKCRAHIWTDVKFGNEAIHDHKCNFASRILKGGYTNINYRDALHTNGVQLRKHLVSATDDSRQAKAGDKIDVTIDGIMEFRERSSFVMPSHQLHQLKNVKPFSMTFTTRGPVRPKLCRILLTDETQIERPQIGLTPDIITSLLYQLKSQYIFDRAD
jgi:hypothetical protein